MNTQKLAQAFLQLSQALTTVHEALLEQQPVGQTQVCTDTAAAQPDQVDTRAAAAQGPDHTAAQGPDQFLDFADELKSILQTVAPGALNVQLSQAIERYAPGAAGQGQGGIRRIPTEQYENFLAEVRQMATALGGNPQ